MRNLEFKPLNEHNIQDCIRGWVAAFPNWKYSDALKTAKEQLESMYFFGAYENGVYKGLIVGVETRFCYRGKKLKGIQLDRIYIEPLYRKQSISRFLIEKFEKFAVDSGYTLVNLGPFNTAFYRNMGYGFGSKVLSFKSKPENFIYHKGTRNNLEYFNGKTYVDELKTFIWDQRTNYHGSWNYKLKSFKSNFKKLTDGNHITVMHIEENQIYGVVTYKANKNIVIDDFLFNKPTALKALSSYLHLQKGHIDSIEIKFSQPAILSTCSKPYEITLKDISMIKVVDIVKFIEEIHDIEFTGQCIKMKFVLHDNLNKGVFAICIEFANGKLSIIEDDSIDVKIKMLLSDFSSMLFSQQSFKTYVLAGLAEISNVKYISLISNIFNYEDAPYNI